MRNRAARRRRDERRRARRNGPECARCGAPVARGSWSCRSCGRPQPRGATVVTAVVAVALLGLAAGAGYHLLAQGDGGEGTPGTQDTYDREVSVKAYRFGFTPDLVTLKKGERVNLAVQNSDFVHGIVVPGLGLEIEDSAVFTPREAGEFAFYCQNYCGSGHGAMQGRLVVEP